MTNSAPDAAARVTPWTVAGSDGELILGNTLRPRGGRPAGGHVVICHGFKGYMDYGFLPRLADAAAELGAIVHRFNFSHSGVTRDFKTFARADLFERDTWNRQVFDLTRVLEERCHGGLPIVLFGHSRGGLTALLTASRLPPGRIAGVITAATPADACRLEPGQREMLQSVGRLASPSGRTGQLLHVGRDWLDQIEGDPAAHDALRASTALGDRVVHIHGDADDTVPVDALHRFAAANPDAKTRVIAGANHVFNAPNPTPRDTTLPPQTAALFDQAVGAMRPALGQ